MFLFLYCAVRKRGEEMLMGHHSIFFWRKISIGWLSTLYQSQSDKEIAEEASVSICTNMYFPTFSINSDWCKACSTQNWLNNYKGGSTLDFKKGSQLNFVFDSPSHREYVVTFEWSPVGLFPPILSSVKGGLNFYPIIWDLIDTSLRKSFPHWE